jgi:hypothetical protein
MKWMNFGIGAVLTVAAAAGAILVFLQHGQKQDTDHIDGGVVKRYWADAPKVIVSSEITEFHSVISLISAYHADEVGHRVYRLDAVIENNSVLVRYDWYDRQGDSDKAEYKTDADFMARLQEIVSAYDFAQYNGYYHSVSGLPDMYGETLDVVYASGERLHVYDNQSGFLPYEAIIELVMLFGAATKTDAE